MPATVMLLGLQDSLRSQPHQTLGLFIPILLLASIGPPLSGPLAPRMVVGPAALAQTCLCSSGDASRSQPGQEQELYRCCSRLRGWGPGAGPLGRLPGCECVQPKHPRAAGLAGQG